MTATAPRKPARSYSISQLCREFEATPRALRFYEELGLISPSRQGAQRIYSVRDRARLVLILRGRKVSLPLAEIREILLAYDQGGESSQDARALRAFNDHVRVLETQRRELDAALDTMRRACERLSVKCREAPQADAGNETGAPRLTACPPI
jgi:DNA-binding transcriptional MerR regulator